jgi:hypothetical protein
MADAPSEPGSDSPAENEKTPTFAEQLNAAAKQSGLAQLKPGETPNARALLGAVGGIRGIVESVLPGIAFLVLYLTTHSIMLAVAVPVVLAIIFIVARIGAHSSPSSAIVGGVLLAIAAVLTIVTKDPKANFVPGMFINGIAFVILIASIIAKWPLIGLIIGLLSGDVTGWREDAGKRRILTLATWLWVVLFAIRLVLEVPLYFLGNLAALGIVRLITSVPLYALFLWITWFLVRGVFSSSTASDDTETE